MSNAARPANPPAVPPGRYGGRPRSVIEELQRRLTFFGDSLRSPRHRGGSIVLATRIRLPEYPALACQFAACGGIQVACSGPNRLKEAHRSASWRDRRREEGNCSLLSACVALCIADGRAGELADAPRRKAITARERHRSHCLGGSVSGKASSPQFPPPRSAHQRFRLLLPWMGPSGIGRLQPEVPLK